MRYVFGLMIVMLGFGAVLQTINNPEAPSVDIVMLGDVSASSKSASQNLIVDRADDPDTFLDCTEAEYDCTLRSAITWANQDGLPTTINFADHFNIVLNKPLPHFTEENTTVYARPGQEVHLNGNGTAGALLQIMAAHIRIEGLRLYGAGAGQAIIAILGSAHSVTIADNVIGDDDAPAGNCQPHNQSYSGITIDTLPAPEKVPAWIYGNIIECLSGMPAIGILVQTDNVIIGQDSQGRAAEAQRNVVRLNQGYGIYIGDRTGNRICNNLLHDNRQGDIFVTNFNNNILDNEILAATTGQSNG
jgi:hypothetical protein